MWLLSTGRITPAPPIDLPAASRISPVFRVRICRGNDGSRRQHGVSSRAPLSRRPLPDHLEPTGDCCENLTGALEAVRCWAKAGARRSRRERARGGGGRGDPSAAELRYVQ
jgi:hypothetical protein